jgi:hypothetical protein
MTTITIPDLRTASNLQTVEVSPAANSSEIDSSTRSVPAFIPSDDAYYWSFKWQRDVRESMAALAAGDYEDFDSDDPNDVVRWLFRIDGDNA